MKKYTLLSVIVFLCFITCSKENTNGELCYSSTLINQINLGDLAVHGLTYNSSCLLSESTEPFTYKKYTYDAQNTLTKMEVANSLNALSCSMIPGQSFESDPRKAAITQVSEFEYDRAWRISKKSNYYINSGTPQLIVWQTYEYDNDRVVKLNTFNAQGKLIQYNEYLYDNRGNIIRDDFYMVSTVIKLSNTKTYEFDTNTNPFQVFNREGTPGKYSNTNNIIKETTVSYNGTAESRSTRVNTYEYNRLGYPVKINELVCFYGK